MLPLVASEILELVFDLDPERFARFSFKGIAGSLNASVAITLGHFCQSCVEGVPKGTAHQETKDCNDNGIGSGCAPLRVIKAWAAIVNAVGSHERVR